jgi:hypothetical protein
MDQTAINKILTDIETAVSLSVVSDAELRTRILKAIKTEVNKNKAQPIVTGSCKYKFTNRAKRAGEICGSKTLNNNEFCTKHTKSTVTTTVSKYKAKSATTAAKTTKSSKPVVSKIESTRPHVSVVKHEATGLLLHSETNLLIDPNTSEVVAKLVNNECALLTRRDIDVCKCYSFKFRIPETINKDAEPITEEEIKHDKSLITVTESSNPNLREMLDDIDDTCESEYEDAPDADE